LSSSQLQSALSLAEKSKTEQTPAQAKAAKEERQRKKEKALAKAKEKAKKTKDAKERAAAREKLVLKKETVFMDTRPSWTEIVLPALIIWTIIGLIPFLAALARQLWVKYEFTSRRIRVQSGLQGKDTTEVIYPEISEMKYLKRGFGVFDVGDVNILLKDGSKLEMRSVPNFDGTVAYVEKRIKEAEDRAEALRLETRERNLQGSSGAS